MTKDLKNVIVIAILQLLETPMNERDSMHCEIPFQCLY